MKFIHLLYIPFSACNLSCKYCYLQEGGVSSKAEKFSALETLDYAVKKFMDFSVMPFNISLHGGEVTMLSKEDFYSVVKFIHDYYQENRQRISSAGFLVGKPHIKTNLYSLDKHIETIKEFSVSISGSLDIPFSLHRLFRTTKNGHDTLDKILSNINLLKDIDNKKKVSATIFNEHYLRLKEIISDIKFLHKNTCLDMNDFNFMIGFDNGSGLLTPLSEENQKDFFLKMHAEFDGTELDKGVNGAWFNEFSPEYCTNCDNCGEKFFLLERNGDIFSCVRGQGHQEFYYGNIYKDSVAQILSKAQNQIFLAHNNVGFNKECASCQWLYLCKTGCPFVKNVYKTSKSYTCLLQQELYKSRGYLPDNDVSRTAFEYIGKMHPEIANDFVFEKFQENSLLDLIQKDEKLKYIYDGNSFVLSVNGKDYPLKSQLLKNFSFIIEIFSTDIVKIKVKKDVIFAQSDYPENNALYIQLLSGDTHVYGDEQRLKQKHVATLCVYKFVLDKNIEDGFYVYDITNFLKNYSEFLSKENANNIFFTTSALRDYHYLKQKNNAYYHIAAINLPFQNMEFNYWNL